MSTAPTDSTPEQLAQSLFSAGKSKAEVWQALIDKQIEAGVATETVTAVASRFEVRCSICGLVVPRATTSLSTKGEPMCNPCTMRSAATEQQYRATASLGPEHSIRRCRRCKKDAMSCVRVRELHFRRGGEMKLCRFHCSACGHGFTGYTGPMPYVMVLMGTPVVIGVASTRTKWGANETVSTIAMVALILFFLFKIVQWRLHPRVE